MKVITANLRKIYDFTLTNLVSNGLALRRPYGHYYLESDIISSRLHLQNFYSFFWPDVDEKAIANVEVYNLKGIKVHTENIELNPFGQLYLEFKPICAKTNSFEGLVLVDLQPGKKIRKKFKEIPNPEKSLISSPFWMSYRDWNDNYMYVHSISSIQHKFKGSLYPINELNNISNENRPTWKSWRLIDTYQLKSVEVVLINHSNKFGETKIQIWSNSNDLIDELPIMLKPFETFRYKVSSSTFSKMEMINQNLQIRVGVDPLLSPNGKPYVILEYNNGPRSIHHG